VFNIEQTPENVQMCKSEHDQSFRMLE